MPELHIDPSLDQRVSVGDAIGDERVQVSRNDNCRATVGPNLCVQGLSRG